ncbi:MAG: DUF2905 domain-containing protein [Deltaproteobacteria bacterium]|nr:DUF2905 domain-containing protein [Deltaproteobacteria bacterium]
MGKTILCIGLILAGTCLLVLMASKFPWIGRLPGDFFFKGKNFSLYFPLTTSLLFSIILTAIFWFAGRR